MAPLQLVDKYILALRIIQPGRIQDISAMILKIWPESDSESIRKSLTEIHAKMKSDGHLVSVRRGTYVLTQEGMRIASKVQKERYVDNARIFLMKEQRKRYHRVARRLG